jgi:5-methylthioribose kinase
MLELTCHNVLDFLREHGWLEPGPARAELLSGGVSNQVLRIIGSKNTFVVKQSRLQLRTRDPWFSDLNRIWREQEVMQLLLPILPPGTVPAVLFADRDNYVYGMSHAPMDACVWKDILLSSEPFATGFSYVRFSKRDWLPMNDPRGQNLAYLVGLVLGMMHHGTANKPADLAPFHDHTVYVQLRVDPFYRRIQERRPEVAHVVAQIIEEMLTRKEALCHGDYTPKNMLWHSGGFTLVDYETAHFGDPTMDLGLFLAHILLKSCRASANRPGFVDLTRSFWRGYADQQPSWPQPELVARGIRHLGVCLLARVDGTSPVNYLSEPQRDAVRQWGRRILLDDVRTWDDVLAVCCEGPRSILSQPSAEL